ncbi:MAG: hypothetical protein HYT89_06635 [Candidatus Omnitrophica bacterium]|nr:hypothetical protein [Candidatus Omnitrophota bacterium]
MKIRGLFFFFLWILPPGFGMILAESSAQAGELESPVYTARGKRDPFVPLVTASARHVEGLLGAETAEDITVEGVVYDPKGGSVVIVSGTLLKEGETVGGVKVVEVKPEGVLFSIHGVESFKPMYPREEDQKRA